MAGKKTNTASRTTKNSNSSRSKTSSNSKKSTTRKNTTRKSAANSRGKSSGKSTNTTRNKKQTKTNISDRVVTQKGNVFEEMDANKLFETVQELDSEKKYSINYPAFRKIESYKLISKNL